MGVDVVPLWVFFVGTIAIILLSVEAGFVFGKHATRRSREEKESPVAAIGAAVLGLVAFMLAFTFSIASGRFDLRKQLVREDANAIRTAWLRADFIPEPDRSELKGLLRQYLDVRVAVAESRNFAMFPQAQEETIAIQKRMWPYIVANANRDNSDISALLVESMNEIIDTNAVRVAVATETRIPLGIWMVLYALSILGMMAVGFQMGIAGSMRSRTTMILAVSFALVITLIAGLDRPNTPFVAVTQKPLRDAQHFMDLSRELAPSTQP